MKTISTQHMSRYEELKQSGISARDVFKETKRDGYKNFECVLALTGIFGLELHEARAISHEIYRATDLRTK